MLCDRYCKECEYLEEDLIEPSGDANAHSCPQCGLDTFERILHYSSNFRINGYNYKGGYQ